jgi:hypothetical protein
LHANKKRLIYFFQVSSWVTLILCTAEARGWVWGSLPYIWVQIATP